ncbi:Probable aspartic proteinase GIP2 [Linum perenne]
MASSSSSSPPILPLYFLIISTLLLSTSAQPSFRPKSLILPTTKDPATLQYTTRLLQRTPRVPLTLLLHLGGENLWVDCSSPNYISSTYTPARCRSSLCSLAGSNGCGDCFSPPSPGCNNNTCGVSPENPITRTSTSGELATDVLELNSTDGSNPTRPVSVPRFLFSCAPSFLTRGLAPGSAGVAGLGDESGGDRRRRIGRRVLHRCERDQRRREGGGESERVEFRNQRPDGEGRDEAEHGGSVHGDGSLDLFRRDGGVRGGGGGEEHYS